MNNRAKKINGRPITRIQKDIFVAMVILTIVMTLTISVISIIVTSNMERNSIDDNLRNIAYVITHSEETMSEDNSFEYLDSIKNAGSGVDVISIISSDGRRIYHTNRELVGTDYDGTMPDFASNGDIYITSDVGPSGPQRRVYAAIYDRDNNYLGFALVVMLNQNIYKLFCSTVLIQLAVTVIVIVLCIVISNRISRKIKHTLWGYEPDAFSAMYSVRDTILETFEEGVIAIDYDEKILFMNKSARDILCVSEDYSLNFRSYPILNQSDLHRVLSNNEKLSGIEARTDNGRDILINYYPVNEKDRLIGAICLLIDRTEYSRIAEDLSGVKFMVDSMRANNHDFTNKLHVILGLIQMGQTQKAVEYITDITAIQTTIISNIMKNIEDPSLAALLIGKHSKARELNISFNLEAGSCYRRSDIDINSGDLITLVGNLIENAFEAMDSDDRSEKELSVGIFTQPGVALIRVDDSGPGIPPELRDRILEAGFTTKGENHGMGLHLINNIVKRYNGTIELQSEKGVGASFTVTLINRKAEHDNV